MKKSLMRIGQVALGALLAFSVVTPLVVANAQDASKMEKKGKIAKRPGWSPAKHKKTVQLSIVKSIQQSLLVVGLIVFAGLM